MLLDRHHFHFFPNRELGSLYFTLGLLHFADGLIRVFIPVYLWKSGFSLSRIILFYTLVSFYFLILTLASLPLLRRLSDKMMMFLSLPFLILYYFGFSFLLQVPALFFLLPLGLAAHMVLFNVGYHMDFSNVSDEDHMGEELGMRHLVVSLTQFASPFLGGVLIATYGFGANFWAGSALLFLAVLPLFFFPKRNISPRLNFKTLRDYILNRSLWPFTVSAAGPAVETMTGLIIWPLFVFFAVGNIEDFGGIISLGLLAGAIIAYLIGFLSDQGQRRKLLFLLTAVFSLVWLSRLFSVRPWAVASNHVGGSIVSSSLLVAWSSQYYKIARAVSDPSAFILSREALYHIVRIPFLLGLAALAYILPAGQFFKVSFFLTALFVLFFASANRLYTANLDELVKKRVP